MSPSVYLLILTWNAKKTVLECVESALKTNYDNLHVVVIDNGSQDGTVEELKRMFSERIELLENGENLRFSRGNNVGIDYALGQQADYIMLLNDDVKVDGGMIHELVSVAESDACIGAVGPKIYFFDPPDQLWFAGGDVYLNRGVCKHRGIRETDHGQYDQITDCGYITGCGLMVKRGVIKNVGMLDPTYPFYYEDADLCMRIRRAGYRLVYVPRAKMWHLISSHTGGQLTRFKIRHKLHSGFIFFARYAKPWHWLTIPFFFAADVMRILLLVLGGKIRAPRKPSAEQHSDLNSTENSLRRF